MSYGLNVPALFQRAAELLDKILRGTKPADIPAEQPTTFRLVVNLKTAKTLGLDVPPTLLAIADEVIEQRCCVLRCVSPLLALSGHVEVSSRCPLSEANRTWPK